MRYFRNSIVERKFERKDKMKLLVIIMLITLYIVQKHLNTKYCIDMYKV